MAILNHGFPYGPTGTVTSVNLKQLVDDASFAAGAVDGSTIGINGSGALYIVNDAVKTSQIANDSVTPSKIDLDNTGIFSFANAAAQKHYSIQHSKSHNANGPLSIDLASGNFQFITVSANITSVANITNAFAGAHFTFVLKYSGTLTGPSTGDWGDKWYFPSTFSGSLTMSNTKFDIISGVVFNDLGTLKYAVTSALDLVTFS